MPRLVFGSLRPPRFSHANRAAQVSFALAFLTSSIRFLFAPSSRRRFAAWLSSDVCTAREKGVRDNSRRAQRLGR